MASKTKNIHVYAMVLKEQRLSLRFGVDELQSNYPPPSSHNESHYNQIKLDVHFAWKYWIQEGMKSLSMIEL